jgi:hypothetical protein
MAEKLIKHYLFASDFDQTLSFNDSGLVLAELLGIPAAEFEHKSSGMAKLRLVQQGAELAYLLLHDPEFRSKVRREHLIETGKLIPLRENIELLYQVLRNGIDGYKFDFFVLSAAPVEIVQAALEGIVPANHIFGTEFKYNEEGAIETIVHATAGYGKVAKVVELQKDLDIGPDHIIFCRRRQLRRARNASRKRRGRADDRGIGFTQRDTNRQAHRAQFECACHARADSGRRGALALRTDPSVLRDQRLPRPRVGKSAHGLADLATDQGHRGRDWRLALARLETASFIAIQVERATT